MNYYLKIADKVFQIETSEPFEIAENIRQFFVEENFAEQKSLTDSRIYYKVFVEDTFDQLKGRIRYRNPSRIILDCESRECRVHFLPGMREPFAYYLETEPGVCEIHILKYFLPKNVINLIFLELLAMEKYLLQENALVLHSSYIICEGKALLFSAPSGTGKSTQARLWEQYKNAKVINGDRSVLKCTEKGIYACGLPFCGSSQINWNESAPLVGIVLLEQAPKNEIERCSAAQATKKLFSECSVNYWNQEFVNQTFEVIEKIVGNVPVYKLKCDISKEAVEAVYREVFG